jgi:hypothetical protein
MTYLRPVEAFAGNIEMNCEYCMAFRSPPVCSMFMNSSKIPAGAVGAL